MLGAHSHAVRMHEGREIKTTERGYGWSWQQLRDRVLREQPLCWYCQAMGLVVAATSVDHMVPKVRGGTDARANLTAACKQCNDTKRDQTSDEFLRARRNI